MLRPTSGAQPNTRIVIKGGTRVSHADAEHLKSQGNSYFQSLEFSNAIDCYSRCLNSIGDDKPEMKTVVLSNRAQACLKLKRYLEAETDADAALSIDSGHLKSL